ncbi:hypothetical protein GCM10023340_36450 [Nocardioides marinquilinus]|uniref:Uncharacterized protein n=1 Tax=Nocardioides marinquilinus TaxID=1210400 RepID=A0ABP9PY10_9ACTN
MTAKPDKPTKHAVGDAVLVKEGGTVVRPDGTEHVVSGGTYVLDIVGTYVVEGSEVTAR